MTRKKTRTPSKVKRSRETPKTRAKKAVKPTADVDQFQQMNGVESTYFNKA